MRGADAGQRHGDAADAGVGAVAVVGGVGGRAGFAIDAAGDRHAGAASDLGFSKVVAGRACGRQVGDGDGAVACAAAAGVARGGRAARVVGVGVARGLGFHHGALRACGQAAKAVGAVSARCGCGGVHGVGAGQRQGHAADARVGGVAVIGGIGGRAGFAIDAAGDEGARVLHFGEHAVGARVARQQGGGVGAVVVHVLVAVAVAAGNDRDDEFIRRVDGHGAGAAIGQGHEGCGIANGGRAVGRAELRHGAPVGAAGAVAAGALHVVAGVVGTVAVDVGRGVAGVEHHHRGVGCERMPGHGGGNGRCELERARVAAAAAIAGVGQHVKNAQLVQVGAGGGVVQRVGEARVERHFSVAHALFEQHGGFGARAHFPVAEAAALAAFADKAVGATVDGLQAAIGRGVGKSGVEQLHAIRRREADLRLIAQGRQIGCRAAQLGVLDGLVGQRPLARRVACGHRVGVKGAAGRRCASGRAVGIGNGRAAQRAGAGHVAHVLRQYVPHGDGGGVVSRGAGGVDGDLVVQQAAGGHGAAIQQ